MPGRRLRHEQNAGFEARGGLTSPKILASALRYAIFFTTSFSLS